MITGKTLPAVLAIVVAASLGARAKALIYLGENPLEAILLKSDSIAIGTVSDFSEKENKATVKVEETIKGKAKGDVTISGVMIRVDSKTSKAAFAKGDRIVIFLLGSDEAKGRLIHAQKLENDAEVKTMKGCIAEIGPVAETLVDLADVNSEIKEEDLHKIVAGLVASKNQYTLIVAGRLMSTRLSVRYKPEGWEDVIVAALSTQRPELLKGALDWAAKYQKMPEGVKTAVAKVAAGAENEKVKKQAGEMVQ